MAHIHPSCHASRIAVLLKSSKSSTDVSPKPRSSRLELAWAEVIEPDDGETEAVLSRHIANQHCVINHAAI